MNRHIDKAMQLRNETPMVSNCAQTIMRAYADELGMTEQQAAAIGCNFGGGMKCGRHLWSNNKCSYGIRCKRNRLPCRNNRIQKKNSRQPRWLNRLRRPSKKQRPERRSKEGTLR